AAPEPLRRRTEFVMGEDQVLGPARVRHWRLHGAAALARRVRRAAGRLLQRRRQTPDLRRKSRHGLFERTAPRPAAAARPAQGPRQPVRWRITRAGRCALGRATPRRGDRLRGVDPAWPLAPAALCRPATGQEAAPVPPRTTTHGEKIGEAWL